MAVAAFLAADFGSHVTRLRDWCRNEECAQPEREAAAELLTEREEEERRTGAWEDALRTRTERVRNLLEWHKALLDTHESFGASTDETFRPETISALSLWAGEHGRQTGRRG